MAAEYDVHRKSYKYGLDDWQLLVNILHEYSEKLLIISRQLSKNKSSSQSKIDVFFSWIFLFNLLLTFLFILADIASKMNASLPWREFMKNHSTTVTVILSVVTVILLILPQRKNNSWNIPSDHFFSLELIEKDARVMSSRLESAIRLTIAVADQVEISLAKKLEMDLRIDEASYALECYYYVSGEKPSTYQDNHKY
jgi:hypothetical protein